MKKFWIGAGLAGGAYAWLGAAAARRRRKLPKQRKARRRRRRRVGRSGRSQRRHRYRQGCVRRRRSPRRRPSTCRPTRSACARTPRAAEVRGSRGQRQRHAEVRFVWVKSGLPDKNWQVPTTPVTLDQSGCMYKPHVIGVMTGQQIEIKNSDPTNHNIHPLPRSTRSGTSRSRREARTRCSRSRARKS